MKAHISLYLFSDRDEGDFYTAVLFTAGGGAIASDGLAKAKTYIFYPIVKYAFRSQMSGD